MGFYDQQIDPVQLSVSEQLLACSLFSETERAEFVAVTVKITMRPKNYHPERTV